MSELDLEAIRARANAATPGPWEAFLPENEYVVVVGPDNDHLAHVFGNLAYGGEETDNAAFITHAREDVPALLGRIAELEERLEEADQAHSREAREHGTQIRRAEAAEQRIAALEQTNAAAMEVVRAVAKLVPGDWPVRHLELSNDLVTQAHALVAGETREEAGE